MQDVTRSAMAPLRILYLSWRDQEHPEAGGAEIFAERTAQLLVDRGHQVTIFASQFAGASRTARHGGVNIVRRGGRFSCYLHGMRFIVRHTRDFDVVLDIQNGVPFWAPLVARVPVVNLTHHVHRDIWSGTFPPTMAAIGWFAEGTVAPRVYRHSRYVTVSQASRDDLAELGIHRDRIDVVHCGNDEPPDLIDYRHIQRSPEPSIVVLGRLVPHKQLELAIDVVADLAEGIPAISMHIVGTGYWEPELREYAIARGVQNRVHFHGFVDEMSKHTMLASSWLLLVPSVKEGWGLNIIEAGIHATPSVAFTAAGGPNESILHGVTGLLASDYSDMVAQVRRLLDDDPTRLRLGTAARKYAQGFSWPSAAKRLEAIFYSAIEEHV